MRIISDLHLGHGASLLACPSELAPLCKDVSRLVFNGDTVELRFLEDRSQAFEEFANLKSFCWEQKLEPLFINGNHDPIVSELNHLDLSGVLVTHGDMLFHDISPWSHEAPVLGAAHSQELQKLGEDALSNFEARLGATKRAALSIELHKSTVGRGTLAKITTIVSEMWPPTRPFKILKVWVQTPSKAAALAEVFRPEAKFVVVGHTHHPGIWRRGARVIINTGSFLTLSRPLCVDIEANTLSVRSIVRRKGQYHPGTLLERFKIAALPNTPTEGLTRSEENGNPQG